MEMIVVLSSVAMINNIVDMGDAGHTFSALNSIEAHLDMLDPALQAKYLKQLKTTKKNKRNVSTAATATVKYSRFGEIL